MYRHTIHLHVGENFRQVAAERIELLFADRQVVPQSGRIFTAGGGRAAELDHALRGKLARG